MRDNFPLNYVSWLASRYVNYVSMDKKTSRSKEKEDVEVGVESNSSVSLDDFLEKYERGGLVSYAPSGKEFEGKIVKFVDYGLPDWLRGVAWMVDDAGRRVAEINRGQDNVSLVETVYHEAGEDGHLGNGGHNESYTWMVNYKRAHMD